MKLDEHLGRRKPDGAAALRDALAFEESLRSCARAKREQLEKSRRDLPKLLEEMQAHADADRELVALIDGRTRAVAEAFALGSESKPRCSRLRICDRFAPDPLRAALADLRSPFFLSGIEDDHFAAALVADLKAAASREPASAARGFSALPEVRPAGALASIASPRAHAIAHLLGADVPAQLDAAIAFARESEAANLIGPALRLGALLAGLATRGASTIALIHAEDFDPIARFAESYSCMLGARSPSRLQLVSSPLPAHEKISADRILLVLRREGEARIEQEREQDRRVRRLIAAGVPTLQLEVPSSVSAGALLALLEIALDCAWRGFAALQGRSINELLPANDALAPRSEERQAKRNREEEIYRASKTPALQEGPLSIHTTPAHAYVLRKIAGTLGKKAETSVPHWLGAQLAMGEAGDVAAIHLCITTGAVSRRLLADLKRELASSLPIGVRVSPGLRDLEPDSWRTNDLQPSAQAGSLHFIISDGGGADLQVGGVSLGQHARDDEHWELAKLADAEARALILRSDAADPSLLFGALTEAVRLFQP